MKQIEPLRLKIFGSLFNYNTSNGWTPAFKDCYMFPHKWLHAFVVKSKKDLFEVGLFFQLRLNQCDPRLKEIFGDLPKCDLDTTYVGIFQID